ncbi:hypothetical protein SEA_TROGGLEHUMPER_121 [Rhodococcus phage Trogglehumper]|uniref:Uncharacterized protein n=1 Tax=Rhodococcus phage Trogglehumper TaxID=3038381 RepID=A0AAF0GL56_9CAUD|nr:hypothetical protein SEA_TROGGLEHUMPER_121 [Rhodococcus phage Trogglehumper]
MLVRPIGPSGFASLTETGDRKMISNALATGRRTYLHESAALDFAIRACEALGLVFWALAPGSDIWATDYSQNTFRVHVGKAANGTRVVTGNGRRAYVAVGERRTVAQADQWSLFSIEEQASDVADTAEHAVTIALEPVLGTDSSVYVARCACGEEFDSINWDDAGYWADRHDARRVDETAETVAPVADTAETPDASSVAVANGYSAEYVRLLDADIEAARTDIERRRLEALRAIATTPVAPTETLEVAAKRMYAVHDQLAELGKGDPGYLVARGMTADSHYFYDQAQARRAGQYVATITDGRKPAQAATVAPVADTADTVPVDHATAVVAESGKGGKVWRAHCTCGHRSATYVAEHAAETMADAHLRDVGAPVEETAPASNGDQGDLIGRVVVARDPGAMLEACDTYALGSIGRVVGVDTDYAASLIIRWGDQGCTYALRLRDLEVVEVDEYEHDVNRAFNLLRGLRGESDEYGTALGAYGRARDEYVATLAVGDRVTVGSDAPGALFPHVAVHVVTGIQGAWATLAHNMHTGTFNVHVTRVWPVEGARVSLERARFAAGDTVLVQGAGRGTVTAYDGNVSVSLEDGSSAYLEASDVTIVAPEYGVETWDFDGASVVPGHAAIATYADARALADRIGNQWRPRIVSRVSGGAWRPADAPSNDVPAETEFAARVRTARAPKVPGIHVARCYRCGERACETLRLPVSSLTNVCREHADEARAVALRWDAASRYMHEEAPYIASSGHLAVIFTREATNRLDVPLPVIARTVIGASGYDGDRDAILARELDAFTAARGTAPSNPVVGK